MTTTPPIVDEAERLVRRLAGELTRVHRGECVACYVARQLEQFGCDNTVRHALRFRDAMAPRATAATERLRQVGAFCDCELFLNGYQLDDRFVTPAHEIEEDGVVYFVDAQEPDRPPPCSCVRRGSMTPCANWTRVRRW